MFTNGHIWISSSVLSCFFFLLNRLYKKNIQNVKMLFWILTILCRNPKIQFQVTTSGQKINLEIFLKYSGTNYILNLSLFSSQNEFRSSYGEKDIFFTILYRKCDNAILLLTILCRKCENMVCCYKQGLKRTLDSTYLEIWKYSFRLQRGVKKDIGFNWF